MEESECTPRHNKKSVALFRSDTKSVAAYLVRCLTHFPRSSTLTTREHRGADSLRFPLAPRLGVAAINSMLYVGAGAPTNDTVPEFEQASLSRA